MLLATTLATVHSAAAANPSFQGYTPPPGYTLEVNGDSGDQLVRDGDILTFTLTEHAYNTCVEGPSTPGCLSNLQWIPWFSRSYTAPFGDGSSWNFRYEVLDPENDCGYDSYTCTVRFVATSNVPCAPFPYIGNIAPLLMSVSGDLGLGFGSSTLPYVIGPRLFIDFGPQDCQPIGDLSWANLNTFEPREIAFDASGSYDPDNLDPTSPADPTGPGDGIVSYSWSFGDGAISFDPSPVHIYNEPGYYDVSLTVTDDEGDIDIILENIAVAGVVNPDFSWSYPDPFDPYTIEFDASPTQSDAEIFTWEWDFGDGETSSDGPTVTHTYADLGEVDVILYAADDFGGSGEITRTVDVGGDPPPALPVATSPFGFLWTEGDSGESPIGLIPVELSEPSATDVTVTWQTVPGTGYSDPATPDVDYVAASGEVLIPAGSVQTFIEVTLVGDDLDEFDEQLVVDLTGAVGAVIPPGEQGLLVIDDDDDPPVATPGVAVVTEGDVGSTIEELVVSLSAPSGKPITLEYLTGPADGVIDGGGPDYVPVTGTLTFAPGETTASIPIEVLGDTVFEPGQLYGLEWGAALVYAPTNATVAPGWGQLGFFVIIDDDGVATT
ncbi:MAG: PKD domain-containing protein [Acidimicrobiales bacterium]